MKEGGAQDGREGMRESRDLMAGGEGAREIERDLRLVIMIHFYWSAHGTTFQRVAFIPSLLQI